jgi:hypothetical protein
MDFQDIVQQSPVSDGVKEQLIAFDNLCFKLMALTQQENEILFGTMFATSSCTGLGKLDLIQKFEDKINHICAMLEKEKLFDTRLLSYLYDCIERLECKIKVNASLHMHNYMQMQSYQGYGQEAYSACH